MHQLQFVSLSISCFIAFSVLWQGLSICRSFFLLFLLYGPLEWQNPLADSFSFLWIITSSGCLARIRWFVCISISLGILCISFSRIDYCLCKYHLAVWLNFSFLHNFQRIIFPTQSYQVLYTFCANLLHSLLMWLIVSSLSQHNNHLLFYCVLKFLFLSHVQDL